MDYPPKVDEWMRLQEKKSSMQEIILFNPTEMIYQVDEPGGTTQDGHSYGGRAYEVHLRRRWRQCERPRKYHWPCSHLLMAEGRKYRCFRWQSSADARVHTRGK